VKFVVKLSAYWRLRGVGRGKNVNLSNSFAVNFRRYLLSQGAAEFGAGFVIFGRVGCSAVRLPLPRSGEGDAPIANNAKSVARALAVSQS
jgi:hypothetical protein